MDQPERRASASTQAAAGAGFRNEILGRVSSSVVTADIRAAGAVLDDGTHWPGLCFWHCHARQPPPVAPALFETATEPSGPVHSLSVPEPGIAQFRSSVLCGGVQLSLRCCCPLMGRRWDSMTCRAPLPCAHTLACRGLFGQVCALGSRGGGAISSADGCSFSSKASASASCSGFGRICPFASGTPALSPRRRRCARAPTAYRPLFVCHALNSPRLCCHAADSLSW